MKTKNIYYEIQWNDSGLWAFEGRDETKVQAKQSIRKIKKLPWLANKQFRLVRVTTTREVVKGKQSSRR